MSGLNHKLYYAFVVLLTFVVSLAAVSFAYYTPETNYSTDLEVGNYLIKLQSDDLMATDKGYGCWYVLDPNNTVKFNLYNDEMPLFISAIPQLLDLDEAQDLDRRKQMQQLLKILIQKLPRDKNGDLIFDVDEARDIHNNAVEMLSRAVGVDVLTTFADVAVEDIADSNTATTKDDLEKVERSVYNSFGVAKNLFNADGNLSLQYSILDDESSIRDLLF